MSGERIERMVSLLLGEAEAAALAGDWGQVEERCRAVLELQPGQEDAAELLAAAARAGAGSAANEPMAAGEPLALNGSLASGPRRLVRHLTAGNAAERAPSGNSRFSYEAVRLVNTPRVECMNAVFRACVSMGIQVVEDWGGGIVGRLGSARKVRLLGAPIAGARALPLRIEVQLTVLPAQSQITVVVSEDFGLGSLRGIDSRVRKRCSQVAAELADAIVSRAPSPS